MVWWRWSTIYVYESRLLYTRKRRLVSVQDFSKMGTSSATTTLSYDKNIIWNSIVHKSWLDALRNSRLLPVLIGVDLERYNKNSLMPNATSSTTKRPYLALVFVNEDEDPIIKYPQGFPHIDLFFNSLKEWEWLNISTHDILIKGSQIELNISDYYKQSDLGITNPVYDSLRLVKQTPNAATEQDPTKKHTTLAISYGDKDPEKITLFCYGDRDDCVFILLKILGTNKRFQFITSTK